ncbi:MAG TPA: hypothetical protein VFH99_01370 [Candidatus Saccharimonadales bacterium]|nr:hypothetical protein [Candidatus Saccharimonadales bacterium]
MDGERRRLFGCFRCGIELRYSEVAAEVTVPGCRQERPETAVINFFEKITGADDFLARTVTPDKTAIDAHRSTPVYASVAKQPSPDAWAGQPNSAA